MLMVGWECTSSGATCKPHRNPTHKQHHELSTWGRIPKANTSEHAGCLEKQTSLSPSGRKGGWRHPVTHCLETASPITEANMQTDTKPNPKSQPSYVKRLARRHQGAPERRKTASKSSEAKRRGWRDPVSHYLETCVSRRKRERAADSLRCAPAVYHKNPRG